VGSDPQDHQPKTTLPDTLLARLLAVDAALSSRLGVSGGPWRIVALLLAHSGDSPLWLAGGGAAVLWGDPFGRAFGLRVLAANLTGGVAATLLKWLFRRGRPGGRRGLLYSRLDRLAFPSGHAARTACMAAALSPLLPCWGTTALTLWAVGVSLARVALQVHYLLDVLAGFLLGFLLGLAITVLLP